MHARLKLFSLIVLIVGSSFPCASQNTSQGDGPAKSEHLVLTATVTNSKNYFVRGLRADNFRVLLDGVSSEVLAVNEADVPTNIGIVWDASGSMGAVPWQKPKKPVFLKQSLTRFVELSHPANDYFVLGFNKSAQLLSDWAIGRTAVDAIPLSRPAGGSALFDALRLAVDKVQQGRYSKRVLIVITDGQDNRSHYTLSDIRQLLRESDVAVYSVTVSNDEFATALDVAGIRVLEQIGSISGGRAFYLAEPGPISFEEISKMFETIATELRSQYFISVKRQQSKRKDWPKIKVVLSTPDQTQKGMKGLKVRTRERAFIDY